MTRSSVYVGNVEGRIYVVRRQRVMLSTHLAELYDVPVKALVQATKRNSGRFPADFMFQITKGEFQALKSQIVTSKGRGGLRRALPYAFTQEGIAMLSSVLRSERAVAVNVEIMRAFVRMRRMFLTVGELARKVEALEKKAIGHDADLVTIFKVLKKLLDPAPPARREIGFHSKSG